MAKLSFSGHETFHCRQFWLKKGVDFILAGNNFKSDVAPVKLGVGKNMVTSIRFWMKAFGLLTINQTTKEEKLSELALKLFLDNGYDPYLEDIASTWLLHYFLTSTKKASIYSLLFCKYRKERIEFSQEQLINFINRECLTTKSPFNINTIKKDISVLSRNYLQSNNSNSINLEDDFSGLLIELDLLKKIDRSGSGGQKWYKIQSEERVNIPIEVILFVILNEYNVLQNPTISMINLLNDENSIGMTFCLNPQGIIKKLEKLATNYDFLTYSDTAGVRELQFKSIPNKWEILSNYYDK